MLNKIEQYRQNERFKQLSDPRNIGMYFFAFIVLIVTWNGIQTIQTNYGLQQKIATLQQQNEVIRLENQNSELQNKYLETDQFLELSARRQFGKAAPGEKLLVIPKDVALSYAAPAKENTSANKKDELQKTGRAKNIQDWKDFLLGRGLQDG